MTLQAQPLNILCINIRSIIGKLEELCYVLEKYDIHLALIQETWLDASTDCINVPGYETIARKDRKTSANRGGVLALCRIDVKNVVLLSDSVCAERTWLLIQRDSGSIAIANWYRPPGEETCMDALRSEFDQASSQADDVIICGDLNIHHRRWLRHSNGNTDLGEQLRTFSEEKGMSQLVKEPTRGEYPLDLVLTNLIMLR